MYTATGPSGLVNHGRPKTLKYKEVACVDGKYRGNLRKIKQEGLLSSLDCIKGETILVGWAAVNLAAGAEITEDYCSDYSEDPPWFLQLKETMGIDKVSDKTEGDGCL